MVAGQTLLGSVGLSCLLTLTLAAKSTDYTSSTSIDPNNGSPQTWVHFTYRAQGEFRRKGQPKQTVPYTTTSSQVLADDPLPTLVYNCAHLPRICRNVENHPQYGAGAGGQVEVRQMSL